MSHGIKISDSLLAATRCEKLAQEEGKPLLSGCWVALQVCAPFPDTQWPSPWPGSSHSRKRPADEPVTTLQHPQGRSHKNLVCWEGVRWHGKTRLHHLCEMLSWHLWFNYNPTTLQWSGRRGRSQSNPPGSLTDAGKAVCTHSGVCGCYKP